MQVDRQTDRQACTSQWFAPFRQPHSFTQHVATVVVEFLQKLGKKLGKNWHIPPNISATSGPILIVLSSFIVMYVRIIKLALFLQ